MAVLAGPGDGDDWFQDLEDWWLDLADSMGIWFVIVGVGLLFLIVWAFSSR